MIVNWNFVKRFTMNRVKNLVLMALFTALIAIGAFLRIPIPMVPITMQYFFTMMAGILLGGRYGTFSVLCYLILGLLGLPIFAQGGGISYVLQPTFGYLIGFVFGTFVTGKIANQVPNPSFKGLMTANIIGMLMVYVMGMIYYWVIVTFYLGTGIDIKSLFLYCFLLTVPGDIISCILAAILGKRLIPLLRKNGIACTEPSQVIQNF